tara:strand:+ start:1823 stop:2188 length:366 start_codon:yes stop_codon:yes gene_type:complete
MANETKSLKEKMDHAMGGFRAKEKCEELHGIKVENYRHLLKITNASYTYRGHGAELSDGKLHYQWRITVSGNTYGIKEMLKSLGMKWNAQDKNWWIPCTRTDSGQPHATYIARLIRKELDN